MKTAISVFVLLWVLINVAGCGYQLRGSSHTDDFSIELVSEGAPQIADQVKRVLSEEGISMGTSQTAAFTVYLRHEKLDRHLLSVSATSGKWEDLELTYAVEMEIQAEDGRMVLPKTLIRLSREYSFDETAVLAKGIEEEVLREELLQDMVHTVLRRLRLKIASKAGSELSQ